MKDLIEKLTADRKRLQEEINKIDKAVSSLRAICSHTDENGKSTWESEGHDSHKEYYKCSICGETDSI